MPTMPPRFAYWTIILDGTPTAFRAREQAELLPTFNRLKQKDPSAMMKWFSQGRLWDSPEAARAERERLRNEDGARYLAEQREKERRKAEEAAPPPPRQPDGASGPRQDREHGPGPRRDGNRPAPAKPGVRRNRDWRPGGEHSDPRDK